MERARAEGALRASEALRRSRLGAVPDAMFWVDKNGRFLEVIPAQGRELYFPPAEFLESSGVVMMRPGGTLPPAVERGQAFRHPSRTACYRFRKLLTTGQHRGGGPRFDNPAITDNDDAIRVLYTA